MTEVFNAYHKWLAIPLDEQPPHHYRLLGLALFESDRDVIETAADQRLGHVRTLQGGKHVAESQKLLNELTAAKLCLLSVEKKSAYDQSLKAQLARRQAAAAGQAQPAPTPKTKVAGETLRVARPLAPARPAASKATPGDPLGFDPASDRSRPRDRKPKPRSRQPGLLVGAGVGIVAVIGLTWVLVANSSKPETHVAANAPNAGNASAATTGSSSANPAPASEQGAASATAVNPGDSDSTSRSAGPAADDARPAAATTAQGESPDEDSPTETPKSSSATKPARDLLKGAVLIATFDEPTIIRKNGRVQIQDLSGNQKPGLLSNGGFAAGKVGQALHCQKVGDHVDWGEDDSLCPPLLSACLWIKPATHTNERMDILTKHDDRRANVGFALRLNNDIPQLSLGMGQGNWRGTSGTAKWPLEEWGHLAATSDGSVQNIYVNGRLVGSTQTVGQIALSHAPFFIGSMVGRDERQVFGLIDEVALFDRAISATEVRQIYQLGERGKSLADAARGITPRKSSAPDDLAAEIPQDDGPSAAPPIAARKTPAREILKGAVLIATFDEPTITRKNGRMRVQDLSGHQKPGLLSNGGFAAGKVGQALHCQKVGDHVDWGEDDSLCPPLFSACAWVKPASHPNQLTDILTKADDQHGIAGFVLRLHNDVPQLSLGVGEGNWRQTDGTAKWPLEEWGHLAATSDGSVQNIYVNGRLVGSTQTVGRIALSRVPFFVGSLVGHDELQFFGLIDEVALFDRAISATEVRQIYQLGERGKSLADAARYIKPGKSSSPDDLATEIHQDNGPKAAPPIVARKTPARDSGKLPIPSSDEQKKANDLVRSVHKADFDKAKSDDAKAELASTLLREAKQTKDDPASQYALFMAASDLAAGGNDIPTAIEAWQALAQVFDADPIEGSWQILKKAPKTKNATELKAALQRFSDEAAQNDRYDLARNAFEALAGMSQAKEAKQFKAEMKRLEKSAEKSREAEAALATLKANPADTASCRTVGEFLCLYKGDWPLGLPLLGRGDDAALAELAKAELAGPRESGSQLALADAWWNFSDKQTDKAVQSAAQVRAVYWYRRALPGTAGITRSKVEGRVSQVLVSMTERVLVRKLRGRVNFDSKTNEAILLYDWTSKTQLDDFETAAATPRLQKGALFLEIGQSITHRVNFTKVGIAVPVFVPQMRGMLLKTSGGAYVRVGGDNPDTLYLGDGKAEAAEVVPDNQRKGIQPL